MVAFDLTSSSPHSQNIPQPSARRSPRIPQAAADAGEALAIASGSRCPGAMPRACPHQNTGQPRGGERTPTRGGGGAFQFPGPPSTDRERNWLFALLGLVGWTTQAGAAWRAVLASTPWTSSPPTTSLMLSGRRRLDLRLGVLPTRAHGSVTLGCHYSKPHHGPSGRFKSTLDCVDESARRERVSPATFLLRMSAP